MNQIVTELPAAVEELDNLNGFNLSSKAQSTPLMNKSDERKHYECMSRQALDQLVLMTEHEDLLAELKWLVDEIDDEVRRYEAKPGQRLRADELNLIGLIDELEMLLFIDDKDRANKRRNRLKRRLYEWNPPRYVVQRMVSELFEGKAINEANCPKLKESKRKILRAQRRYHRQRNKLTDANLRLVFSVANRFRYLGMPFEDLVQEGSIGLIKAIERFEHRKGFLFSTYAYRVISQAIHLAVERNEHLVRRPYKQLREKAVVDQTRTKLEQTLGRPVRASDLRKHLPDNLEHTPAHIDNNAEATAVAWSPTAVLPEPQDHAALDEDSQNFQSLSLNYKDLIEKSLSTLDERSETIVRLRYGIGVPQTYTLKEISERLSLSSERVRQIAKSAVQKLQDNAAITAH